MQPWQCCLIASRLAGMRFCWHPDTMVPSPSRTVEMGIGCNASVIKLTLSDKVASLLRASTASLQRQPWHALNNAKAERTSMWEEDVERMHCTQFFHKRRLASKESTSVAEFTTLKFRTALQATTRCDKQAKSNTNPHAR
eukprot:6488391-Amphidinium_carterae.1